MALLFDIAVLIVIFFGVSLLLPNLIQSDYKDIQDQITSVNDLHSARSSIDDAQKSLADAKSKCRHAVGAEGPEDPRSRTSPRRRSRSRTTTWQSSCPRASRRCRSRRDQPTAKALQKQADSLNDKIKTTGYIVSVITLVLALLYLVPITAITGHTLGMRRRKIKVVRVNGAPVGWYASFVRFAIPLLLAVAIPQLGALLGLGMVLWGYFDRNHQGLHDKLAKTVVVDA